MKLAKRESHVMSEDEFDPEKQSSLIKSPNKSEEIVKHLTS